MWLPLLLMILGRGVQNKETNAASKRALKEVRKGREDQAAISDKKRKAIMANAETLDPATRQERMDTSASETTQGIMDLLAQTQESSPVEPGLGRVSAQSLKQRAALTRKRANESSIMAALAGKLEAPSAAGALERGDRRGLDSLLTTETSNSRRSSRVADLLASLEGRTNNNVMMAGGLAEGAGMSMLSGQIMAGLAPAAGAAGTINPAVGAGITTGGAAGYTTPYGANFMMS